MIVFHGSTLEIRNPDAVHSKRFLDFGPGFYVTSFREQAERWARRKSARRGGPSVPVVNEYELDDDFAGFSVLRFGEADEAWLDFVCDCRDGKDVHSPFDVIVGRVADDDVFRTVQSWRQGDISKSRALELLRFAAPNDQIVLKTARILSEKLRFVRSYRIPREA